jgi:Family of unknown function (DUF6504)
MARRIGEPVMVRVAGEPDGAPGTFLWRDRVYVVREVLGHWQERRSWWASAAARAVHGDHDAPQDPDQSAHRAGMDAESNPGDVLNQEREIWRVEASAGRMFGNGVYDLARDGSGGAGAPVVVQSQGWHLLRVAD